MNSDDIKRKIQEAWNQNPIQVVMAGAFALTAFAKLIDALNNSRNSKSWARETRRRDRKDRGW